MAKRSFLPRRRRIPFRTFNPNVNATHPDARLKEDARSLYTPAEIERSQKRLERLFGFKEEDKS